jgi:hypothetical protein
VSREGGWKLDKLPTKTVTTPFNQAEENQEISLNTINDKSISTVTSEGHHVILDGTGDQIFTDASQVDDEIEQPKPMATPGNDGPEIELSESMGGPGVDPETEEDGGLGWEENHRIN